MCSTIPSSDGVGLRDGGRAPAAVGDGLHLDRAAPAAEGAALLAARPPRRRLQRHPALARGVHRVSSRVRSVGSWATVSRAVSLCDRRRGLRNVIDFLGALKYIYLPKETPSRHSWKSH